MIRHLIAATLALGVAQPLSAEEKIAPELAESRLRGCMLAGSSAIPPGGLRQAVLSIRSFCATQIKRVQADRVEAATAGLEGQSRDEAEDRAIRQLNDEIARAIANFTGLTS